MLALISILAAFHLHAHPQIRLPNTIVVDVELDDQEHASLARATLLNLAQPVRDRSSAVSANEKRAGLRTILVRPDQFDPTHLPDEVRGLFRQAKEDFGVSAIIKSQFLIGHPSPTPPGCWLFYHEFLNSALPLPLTPSAGFFAYGPYEENLDQNYESHLAPSFEGRYGFYSDHSLTAFDETFHTQLNHHHYHYYSDPDCCH